MYKIKRFSSSVPKGLGVERYYSEYLEQREYGLGKEIKELASHIKKNGMRGGIRKFKEAKLDELSEAVSGSSIGKKTEKISRLEMMIPRVNRPEVTENLTKAANKDKTAVLDIKLKGGGGNSAQARSSLFKKDKGMKDVVRDSTDEKGYKEFENAVEANKNIIFHPKSNGPEELAHEMGHVKNSRSLNPVHRTIHNKSSHINMKELAKDSKESSGYIKSGINYLKGKTVLSEEARATKNAENIMRKAGMIDEEIENSTSRLKNMMETYKINHEIAYKNPLINKLKKDLGKE